MPLFRVGAHDGDVRDLLLDLVEETLHGALHRRIGDPAVGLEDELALHLAVAEARALEQVEGGLALGAGQLELGVERAADHAGEHEGADQGDDPGHEDTAAASVHRSSESFEHGGGTSRSSGSGASRIWAEPPLLPEVSSRYSRPVPAAYQSLYRKYRPQRFSEVVGQTHVTAAVRNAVRDERVGHAYLFSGPRGTGKTTMARLLAKALNCTARTARR